MPAERVAFMLEMLEMLESISYVRNPRARSAKKKRVFSPDEMDTMEYILSSLANAESIRRSMEQLDRGEYIYVEIPADTTQPAQPVQLV